MKWESYAHTTLSVYLKAHPHHRHFLQKLIKVFIQTKILEILRNKTPLKFTWNPIILVSRLRFMVFWQNCIYVLQFSTFSFMISWKTAEIILIFTPNRSHYLKVLNFWFECSFLNYSISMIWVILFKRNIFIIILEHDLKVIGKTQ